MIENQNPSEDPSQTFLAKAGPQKMVDITFHIKTKKWEKLKDIKALTREVIELTLLSLKLDSLNLELSIILAHDSFIQKYNLRYRGKDKPTNVLSFSAVDQPFKLKKGDNLGDIMIAFETIEKEAKEQDKSFKDHYIHIVIHGMLHLIGYDHQNKKEAEEMEAIEIQVLKKLGIQNPYDSPSRVKI